MQEQFSWLVETVDGQVLREDSTNFKEVIELNRQGKVRYFSLVDLTSGITRFVVKLGGERRLIFFRRRMNHIDNKGTFQWTITLCGWQENVKGVTIKSILYIYPNGGVELNNDESTLAMAYHEKLISQL